MAKDIAERDITMVAQWGKTARTDIPVPPISGIAYRNTGLGILDIESGQSYDKVYDSARYNQFFHQLSGLTQMLERYGILPWSEFTQYRFCSLCLGMDGKVYQALQPSGPGPSGGPKKTDNVDYWKEIHEELWAALEDALKKIQEIRDDVNDAKDNLNNTNNDLKDTQEKIEKVQDAAMPRAKSGSGAGQLMCLTDSSATLGNGGSWMYYYWKVDDWSTGVGAIQRAGVAAGGTTLWTGMAMLAGFAWRITE